MPLISVKNLFKTYHLGEIDVPVLRGVSLAVEKGEFVALMGASGSGKSTLMNILGCLDRATSGEYWLEDQNVSNVGKNHLAEVRNQLIGFVFQSFNLLSRTSALDNVMMPLTYSPRSISENQARKRATELLKLVGLGERMDHHPSQLSGGQQQRVAIARSLVNKPSLLLADEPTGNLDSRTSEDVLKLFDDLNAKEGITIMIVTHAKEIADHTRKTIQIKDGLIVAGHYSGGGAGVSPASSSGGLAGPPLPQADGRGEGEAHKSSRQHLLASESKP